MFPRERRVRKKEEYQDVFRRGKTFYFDFLKIIVRRKKEGKQRFGFIVSKQVAKKAVDRNKIKRRLRAICYKHQELFPDKADIVVVADKKIKNKSFQEIEEKIKKYGQGNFRKNQYRVAR